MNQIEYYDRLAAAYVRGYSLRTNAPELPERWKHVSLSELNAEEYREIIKAGKEAGLKIYRFKTTHSDMPRIKKVLGFLKGISFESLLDAGSGRGVFLLPFLMDFPGIGVTSLDVLPHRVEFLQDISRGGISTLTALCADICTQPLPEKSADVVTLLEVLEHIPDVGKAVQAAVKIARKFVVVSVPSKPDNNPEHIHLLTKEKLTGLFAEAGCTRLRFDGVNGHLIMIANTVSE